MLEELLDPDLKEDQRRCGPVDPGRPPGYPRNGGGRAPLQVIPGAAGDCGGASVTPEEGTCGSWPSGRGVERLLRVDSVITSVQFQARGQFMSPNPSTRQPRTNLRIGAVDDHPVILAGVSEGLRWHLPGAVVAPVTRHVSEFLEANPTVDVVLLDVELHDGSDAADNVRRLTARGWPVLLFTQDLRLQLVARTFRAGAAGILSKGEDLATIARAVLEVAAGEPYLSPEWAAAISQDEGWTAPNLAPREVEAIRLYAAGRLTSVARRLGSARTRHGRTCCGHGRSTLPADRPTRRQTFTSGP